MRCFQIACLLGLLAPGCLAEDGLVGIAFDGRLFRIDAASGVGTFVADLGNPIDQYNCLAANADSVLHTMTVMSSNLYRINVLNPGTFVVHNVVADGISALTFEPGSNRWLFGTTLGGGVSDLYRFDLSAPYGTPAVKKLIAKLNFAVTAMQFAPNGDLYAWDPGRGLIRIDPQTGASLDVNASVVGPSMQSMAFTPSGDCYGAYDQLFSINIQTGVATPLPSSGFDSIRGLAWYAPNCQADCEGDDDLDVDDFICFQTLFALNDPTADCDGTLELSIDDFICFQTVFALGC